MEKSVELEISPLLPGVGEDDEACFHRLAAALASNKKLIRAHLERENEPVKLCLHYDPELMTLADLKRTAQQAGAQIINRYHHEVVEIEGMDCSDCAMVVEHSVSRIEGVLTASVSYPGQIMRVEFDSHKTSRAAIEKRVRSLGYAVQLPGLQTWFLANRELLSSVFAGLLLLIGWLGGQLLHFPGALSLGFYLAAYGLGGWDVFRHALHTLIERAFDTDLLMVLAALGAAALGDFADGALLIFLFSLGHALEERALERARSAVRALADLTPKTALVRRSNQELEIPLDQVVLQEVVILRPGTRIPIDGIVLRGASAVNQAPVTGESIPVEKAPGDKLFAGTINGEGALEAQATRLAKDSTLARVMKLVEEAQTQKSPTQQTVEKFEGVFVPGVLIVTILVIFLPPLFGVPFHESFLRAMTLLVAASPCALALGTPAAILAGIGQAARNGILIKGGAHLENLGRLKAIAFDKTGTITSGLPEVTGMVTFPVLGGPIQKENDLLGLAAAVESRSGHPLGQAIVRAARDKQLVFPDVSEVEAVNGRGIQATVAGHSVRIGSLKWLDESGVSLSAQAAHIAEEWQVNGQTLMGLAWGQELAGLIGLADTLRAEFHTTLQQLNQAGLEKTILLTGDNARVAEAVARQSGVSQVMAGLMPEGKLAAIRALTDRYGVVAMVGDGVNDAPALANATVGIAMGGAGTDVALETADVALMGDDLSKLPFAIGLGRATRAVILQNLVIAVGVIGVLVVTSLTGLAGIGVAIVFHEGSTILVVLNALRLLRYHA
ncbi:MAG: cation-translocating P-type ATPase [Anaerolineaceae bacterium]|nr:cation-translocating P-type ATPase [Anaerolineaceae bacterium]